MQPLIRLRRNPHGSLCGRHHRPFRLGGGRVVNGAVGRRFACSYRGCAKSLGAEGLSGCSPSEHRRTECHDPARVVYPCFPYLFGIRWQIFGVDSRRVAGPDEHVGDRRNLTRHPLPPPLRLVHVAVVSTPIVGGKLLVALGVTRRCRGSDLSPHNNAVARTHGEHRADQNRPVEPRQSAALPLSGPGKPLSGIRSTMDSAEQTLRRGGGRHCPATVSPSPASQRSASLGS